MTRSVSLRSVPPVAPDDDRAGGDVIEFAENARSRKEKMLLNAAPFCLKDIKDEQTAVPRIARDKELLSVIEHCISEIPTTHDFYLRDARDARALEPGGVHLVVTSPPYWTLKKYNGCEGQMGAIEDYEEFLRELNKVWESCYHALVPGARMAVVVGDVCLSRRKNNGRHTVVPLHAAVQEQCRRIGFDNLAPVIWSKIANASYEAGGKSPFLGKPYEPNAVIKNDIEFILMQRKPGGYRSPSFIERVLSVLPRERHSAWFRQIWTDIPGASAKDHPAPYPLELANRLVRMFSFAGDTVYDPFAGSGTTAAAAARAGRNSISSEIDPAYLDAAVKRFEKETKNTPGAGKARVSA